jgi:hypothetical protein
MAADLPPPERIHWLDDPVLLMGVLDPERVGATIRERVPEHVKSHSWGVVSDDLDSVVERALKRVQVSIGERLWERVRKSLLDSVERALDSARESVRYSVLYSLPSGLVEDEWGTQEEKTTWDLATFCVRAYDAAPQLALLRFFDEYLASNEGHALAHFNEVVSGYWLEKEDALVVRSPHLLAFDAAGWLHSTTGKCLEYPGG